jgi:hypothetical protein
MSIVNTLIALLFVRLSFCDNITTFCQSYTVGHEESVSNVVLKGVVSQEWKGLWNSKRQTSGDKEFVFQYIQPIDVGLSIASLSVKSEEPTLKATVTSKNEITSISNLTVITINTECPAILNGVFMLTMKIIFQNNTCNSTEVSWLKMCGYGMAIPRKSLFVSLQKSKSSGIIVEDGIQIIRLPCPKEFWKLRFLDEQCKGKVRKHRYA